MGRWKETFSSLVVLIVTFVLFPFYICDSYSAVILNRGNFALQETFGNVWRLNKKLFFNYSLCSILFCFSFSCTAQCLDNYILYKMIPRYFKYPTGTIQSYYSIINYISYVVLYRHFLLSQLRGAMASSGCQIQGHLDPGMLLNILQCTRQH